MTSSTALKKIMSDIIDSAISGNMKDSDRIFQALCDHYRLLGCIGEIRDAVTHYINTVDGRTESSAMYERGREMVAKILTSINEALK